MKLITLAGMCLLICVCQFHADAQQSSKYIPGQSVETSREQWQQLTTGVELARDKKVFFLPKPNYSRTNDKNDSQDLTDGALSARADGRLWFDKSAVGWWNGAGSANGILMVIDLGSEQPIGQIAIRVLGGKEQSMLELPQSVEFLASADGEQYHSLQKSVKLAPGDAELADSKIGYYFPEEGKSFIVPLVSHEAVTARYVALRVMPRSSLFVDQISILKASDSTPLKQLKSFPETQIYPDGMQLFFDGFAVAPRHIPFTVTTNVVTPNWLRVQDNSGLNLSQTKAEFKVELPQGLRILPQSEPAFKVLSAGKVNTYLFSYDGKNRNGFIGPLWIEKENNTAISADAQITITGILNEKDSHRVSYPIHLLDIPEAPQIKGLDISLAWLYDKTEQQWPNFLRDFHKMGFNYVSTFPRNFGTDKNGFASQGGKWNTDQPKSLDFSKQARKQGYGIVYNESPFHVMWHEINADLKAGKMDDAEAEKLFTQVNGKRGTKLNILYRGKYFQDEIKRVADAAALVQPDHVYLDIELWGAHVNESKKDPRVIAAWKKSGKDWDDFATDVGADVLGTLVKAMRQAVPKRKLTVGLYSSDPQNVIYTNFFAWKKLYPEVIDIAQPSLYVQGKIPIIADRIRSDYDAMQTRQIIPWLSTGTHGEYDPKLTEPMVLETILNGARGLTYYWFGDFDPMDFYYHSKAIAELAPYEKLLQSGKPIAYKGDNPDLHYTVFASTNEALVLVGNYNNSAKTKVDLALPIKSATKVLLGGKALAVKNNTVSIEVPEGEFRLVYFSN